MIREMVELSRTKEQAHEIAARSNRTWGVWLGVGDSSQEFLAMEYMHASALSYDDSSLPGVYEPMVVNRVFSCLV